MNGWPDSQSQIPEEMRPYWNFRDELSEADGVLLKGERLIIPSCLQQDILQRIHMGHMGITRCTQRAREVVFWPGMNKEITEMVEKCDARSFSSGCVRIYHSLFHPLFLAFFCQYLECY